MSKVIKLDFEEVVIANEDGSTLRAQYEWFNFKPEIGDSVEVFPDGEEYIIHKKNNQKNDIEDKISINIVNENTQQQNNGVYVQAGKLVNKIAYLLITLFLGAFGGQKFYEGKIGSGIACLFFSWTLIPSLIALIDFIKAALKTPDANGNIIV